jgi:hypothetical protein
VSVRRAFAYSGTVTFVAAALLLAGGCGGDGGTSAATTTTAAGSALPTGSEPANLDPANFVDRIDNPYLPMIRGSRWVYREREKDGTVVRVELTVTNRKKEVLGIEATVVRDVVTEDGVMKEDTVDWFAQDKQGNVWYLGEFVKNYKNGKLVDNEGSWEAGVDGAEAGIIMPAKPATGMKYRQEYYEGEAEDRGEVLALNATATVPFGKFTNLLKTEDTTPLEPQVREHKYYARGIGVVLVVDVAGGNTREELLSFKKGR